MIVDSSGTLLPVSGGLRGLPGMSLSIPPTLNSGDVRNVNLVEVVSLPCLCQPTAVNLPGHSDISEQQGCWVLGNGKVFFSQASS